MESYFGSNKKYVFSEPFTGYESDLTLNFETLPPELIFEICENMEFKDLGRFIRTNKKYRSICEPILDRRIRGDLESFLHNFLQYGIGHLLDKL